MLLDEKKFPPLVESEWVAKVKYDGYRVLAQFGDGACSLRTKNGADCTKCFPEVSTQLSEIECARMVVDGEMCILDGLGSTDFDALHSRARRRRYAPGDTPVTYCVFDIVVSESQSAMGLPLLERKAILAGLLADPPPNVYSRATSTQAMSKIPCLGCTLTLRPQLVSPTEHKKFGV